ncbi:ABC transporter ATP-binding protein [Metapseudomonas furukawaii]|uniref:Spermidine/putrescine import ATP-binding protein PotA n=1 Tax=Metapseudomonas furukawaii TaxID=1149133 RepID=A0AAD1BWR6_METFU|nr:MULTISPECIES: ABC transporter ATP-binding protein [Pseudomonas]ELS24689.1 Putrescine transport ATP-binding protein PotA [Pseudomonas furukawaii]OWJ91343.1 spermidine/putrescine ABC transporter ATP-binding protein [Pseudomonas sp. A46]WAG79860.1 ABC transporter ATP-binding protein [Pseudomonas furukawaii]BAU72471.1 putrescine transport ATP-binding protein PotA [Pseudomonas furukawaii]
MSDASETFDIEFRQVVKRYGAVTAVDGLDFAVRRGAFHSFLGSSGCGKTTTLRMIAGFEQPSEGEVLLAGRSVAGVPAHQRPVNMVFQSYALFPHLSVLDNIAYGLRYRQPRPDRALQRRLAEDALEMVRLGGFGQRKPHELSGGQQQRVALARALVNKPTVLLLDEPLAALDRKLRKEMQSELLRLQREVGITFVLVTHDQEEALSMSDTISVMQDGRILQSASPEQLYETPASRYVADFIGESNLFDGTVRRVDGNRVLLETAQGLQLASPQTPTGPALKAAEPGCIAVRPELIAIGADAESLAREISLTGQVVDRIYLGNLTEYRVRTEPFGIVCVRVPRHGLAERSAFEHGAPVRIGWDQASGLAMTL